MCPMRIFLVFFSAVLASYLAWKQFKQTERTDTLEDENKQGADENLDGHSSQTVLAKVNTGLRTLVDMASGKYLWLNLKSQGTRSTEFKEHVKLVSALKHIGND